MPKPSIWNVAWLKTRRSLLLVAAGVLVPLFLVNPFREMLSEDDSWAYARMVEHLLATGRYELDAWAAANMPVQIYLAAAASKLFGYSLSLLRCTTLALFVAGIASFYLLLRELGRSRAIAALTTCTLIASPLVLMLAFTFMSDVQFLGWLLLSLWLYVRSISRASVTGILLASIAAGCAIGTRQFGVAILVGLMLSWLLCHRENRLPIRSFLAGAAIPLLAAAAQIYIGLRRPTFTQAYRMAEQHGFLHHSASALASESVWRLLVILQYAGMCLIPLLPILAATNGVRSWRKYAAIATSCLAVIAALSIGSPLTARPEAQHRGMWEPLTLYWLLPTHLHRLHWAMRLLDVGGIAGAGYLAWMLTDFFRSGRWRSPAALLLAGTGGALVLLHLSYVQLNDTYIAALIPFVLLLASGVTQRYASRGLYACSAIACLGLIVAASLWMRAESAAQEAVWTSADALLRSGVAPQDIGAPLHWAEYHGAFDDWVAVGAPCFVPSQPSDRGRDALHDPFYAWLNTRSAEAEYMFLDSAAPYNRADWQPIRTVAYRNARFSKRQLVTLRRR